MCRMSVGVLESTSIMACHETQQPTVTRLDATHFL